MYYDDFIAEVAEKIDLPKVKTKEILNVVAEVIKENVLEKSEKIKFADLGTFMLKKTKGKENFKNPFTNETINIPPKKSIIFKSFKSNKMIDD